MEEVFVYLNFLVTLFFEKCYAGTCDYLEGASRFIAEALRKRIERPLRCMLLLVKTYTFYSTLSLTGEP